MIGNLTENKDGPTLKADIIWETCPANMVAVDSRKLIQIGVTLPDFNNRTASGEVCMHPHTYAKLINNAEQLVQKSRSLSAQCARLTQSMQSIADSTINCNNINTLVGITDDGKQAFCSLNANCKYTVATNTCALK